MPCKLSILIIEDSGTVGTQNWGIRCLPILINEQAGGRIGSASNSLLKLLRIPSERHALSSKWQYIWDSVNLVWPAIFFWKGTSLCTQLLNIPFASWKCGQHVALDACTVCSCSACSTLSCTPTGSVGVTCGALRTVLSLLLLLVIYFAPDLSRIMN